MSQGIVQVENLNLAYKGLRAVQNVSFQIKSGEILAIIGQNGSGKTSTVECIEGLRKPDSGLVQVFGKDPWLHRSEIYKEMGIQLQEVEYPSKIRVEEQCRLFASFYERPADWDLLLTQLGLDKKRKQPIHKLSGGEKQRLSILLSLMGRPKLLVLDELTTGLDPEVRQNMWISFENIRKNGVAIIMVSHYLDEVEALADKILYLEKGKQQFFGTQQGFREYVKSLIPQNEWKDNYSLEKLYLMIAPKTTGLTMEGIL
ncbi:ABC transporter ATP-binding protein [bacterium 1xD8-6]|nr:ABC transporter ATP-binding protein [bacterium D16-36]RKI71437.1 ABC transporter ATP-binding protein [bacterium 1xD8-6]